MWDKHPSTVEDFLADETFQAYCDRSNLESVHYWQEWLNAHPTLRSTFEEAEQLYKILSGNRKPLGDQSTLLTRKIHQRPSFLSSGWLQIAATLLLCSAIALWLWHEHSHRTDEERVFVQHEPQHYETQRGQKKKITLSDGTIVFLNAVSQLHIAADFNNKQRNVYLTGEAFFEVGHDPKKPFIVHTGTYSVNVLGTKFNVRAYPTEPNSETTLIEGSVIIQATDANTGSIELKPLQKVTFKLPEKPKQQPAPQSTSTDADAHIEIVTFTEGKPADMAETAWTENRLVISERKFFELKNDLERWFDVEIEFASEEAKNLQFTATFTSSDPIITVLNALQRANHFEYDIDKDKLITIR